MKKGNPTYHAPTLGEIFSHASSGRLSPFRRVNPTHNCSPLKSITRSKTPRNVSPIRLTPTKTYQVGNRSPLRTRPYEQYQVGGPYRAQPEAQQYEYSQPSYYSQARYVSNTDKNYQIVEDQYDGPKYIAKPAVGQTYMNMSKNPKSERENTKRFTQIIQKKNFNSSKKPDYESSGQKQEYNSEGKPVQFRNLLKYVATTESVLCEDDAKKQLEKQEQEKRAAQKSQTKQSKQQKHQTAYRIEPAHHLQSSKKNSGKMEPIVFKESFSDAQEVKDKFIKSPRGIKEINQNQCQAMKDQKQKSTFSKIIKQVIAQTEPIQLSSAEVRFENVQNHGNETKTKQTHSITFEQPIEVMDSLSDVLGILQKLNERELQRRGQEQELNTVRMSMNKNRFGLTMDANL